MRVISVDKLYNSEYALCVLNALRQFWLTQSSFCSIGSPKKQNNLLYLYRCKAKYTTKTGKTFFAQSGDIVYTPTGSEYTVKFYDIEKNVGNTIGVNYFMSDEQGEPFLMSDDICVFTPSDSHHYYILFSKLDELSQSAVHSPGRLKSALYEIISELGSFCRHDVMSKKYSVISEGIVYLEEDCEQTLRIGEIAGLCNVSEIYFRKLFKKYSGLAPAEYRLNAKIERAKRYLEFEELNVREISEACGFSESAYFCRQFKFKTGMTPLQYKKSCV